MLKDSNLDFVQKKWDTDVEKRLQQYIELTKKWLLDDCWNKNPISQFSALQKFNTPQYELKEAYDLNELLDEYARLDKEELKILIKAMIKARSEILKYVRKINELFQNKDSKKLDTAWDLADNLS